MSEVIKKFESLVPEIDKIEVACSVLNHLSLFQQDNVDRLKRALLNPLESLDSGQYFY